MMTGTPGLPDHIPRLVTYHTSHSNLTHKQSPGTDHRAPAIIVTRARVLISACRSKYIVHKNTTHAHAGPSVLLSMYQLLLDIVKTKRVKSHIIYLKGLLTTHKTVGRKF